MFSLKVPNCFNPLASLGLAAVSVVAAPAALALTTTEVAERLAPVPVFILGVVEGERVVFIEESVDTNDGGQTQVTRIYLNPEDAQADLALIQSESSDLPSNTGVAQLSLGDVFCISQQNTEQPCGQTATQSEAPPEFVYFPDRNQLNNAIALLEEQGTNLGEDTPLFVPLFYTNITIPEQEQSRTVPVVFFSQEDLERDIAGAQEETPELSEAEFSIEVTTLSRMIGQLITQDGPGVDEIRFVPASFGQESGSSDGN